MTVRVKSCCLTGGQASDLPVSALEPTPTPAAHAGPLTTGLACVPTSGRSNAGG